MEIQALPIEESDRAGFAAWKLDRLDHDGGELAHGSYPKIFYLQRLLGCNGIGIDAVGQITDYNAIFFTALDTKRDHRGPSNG